MDSAKGIATFGSGGMGRGTTVIRLKLPSRTEKTIMRFLIVFIISAFIVSVGSTYFVLEKCGVDNPDVADIKMRLSTGLILMSIAFVLLLVSTILEKLKQSYKLFQYLGMICFIVGVFLIITIIPSTSGF